MRTLARWCFRHRWLVLVGWLVGLFVLGGLANGVGDNYKDEFKLSGTDSFDAIHLLQRSAPKASGDQEQIVVAAKDGRITDARNRDRVEQMLAKVKTLPHVETVDSPFASGNEGQVSKDGRIAFANVTMDDDVVGLPTSAADKLVDTAQDFADDSLQV
jgi:RND superfamily putative drug exporter